MLGLSFTPSGGAAQNAMIDGDWVASTSDCDLPGGNGSRAADGCRVEGSPSALGSDAFGSSASDSLSWLDSVRVGYDEGFVIASQRHLDLETSGFPFRLQINGWGQLRYTVTDVAPPNIDLNQFQLKRGRLVLSGHAFSPDVSYFVQFDGRSSSGDNMRLLDYYLSYDIGHGQFGLDRGTLGFRTGKYKMPFTMARWLSGKQFEFTDRSVASTYFDVNRSLACGLYGQSNGYIPVVWETAIFNGFVTGGAETGSSGDLDDNFAYSVRLHGFPIGQWGTGELADFEDHDQLAMRAGCAFAATTISRSGTTEFDALRVVDTGSTLASILPVAVDSYHVTQFAVDTSLKLHGWSTTFEYYFRNVSGFQGASVPDLYDHGFWCQLGYFIVPNKLQLLARWSRVAGDSGTLGVTQQSTDEIAGGLAWYFHGNHAKLVCDVTRLNGAPINSSALDVTPGDHGWLYRTQIQFSF